MPVDWSRYPADWRAFSRRIRDERAGGRCECEGECGLHRTNPGPRRCLERNGEPAVWARGRVVLTVAHLNRYPDGPCRCEPHCAIDAHVKAMCQRCHLRYDALRHAENRTRNRDRRRGQARLFDHGIHP